MCTLLVKSVGTCHVWSPLHAGKHLYYCSSNALATGALEFCTMKVFRLTIMIKAECYAFSTRFCFLIKINLYLFIEQILDDCVAKYWIKNEKSMLLQEKKNKYSHTAHRRLNSIHLIYHFCTNFGHCLCGIPARNCKTCRPIYFGRLLVLFFNLLARTQQQEKLQQQQQCQNRNRNLKRKQWF